MATRKIGEFTVKGVKYACYRIPKKEYYLIRISKGIPIGTKIVTGERLTPFSNSLSEWFDNHYSKLPSYDRINKEITEFLKAELEIETNTDDMKRDQRKITRLLNKYVEEFGERYLAQIKDFKITRK